MPEYRIQSSCPLFTTEADALAANLTAAPTLADFEAHQNLLLAPYGFGGVLTEFTPDANSWYHGGSARFERRFSNNLTFQASYTFSKTIDLIENDLFTSFVNPRRPFNHLNPFQTKGLSGSGSHAQVRHRLALPASGFEEY